MIKLGRFTFSTKSLMLIVTALCLGPFYWCGHQVQLRAKAASAVSRLNDVSGGVRVKLFATEEGRGTDFAAWVLGDDVCRKARYANFFATQISDKDLAPISDLQCLEELGLAETAITDTALVDVAQLRHLRVLSLERTKITDAGIGLIAKIDSLEELDLSGTEVTDAGLMKLSKLRSLHRLDISDTKVTQQAKRLLTRLLPQVQFIDIKPELF